MKKKQSNYIKDFKMPRLFRDDLENIDAIMKDELQPSQYKIDFGDFEYEGINEISREIPPVNDFHITSYDPYVKIDLSRASAKIYADDDGLKTRGAVEKIVEIIQNRQRRYRWFFSLPGMSGLPMGLFIFALMFGQLGGWIIFLIFGVTIGLTLIIFYQSLKKFSTIEFVDRNQRPNFFARKKDDLLLIIISAGIGSGFTILFSQIFHLLKGFWDTPGK